MAAAVTFCCTAAAELVTWAAAVAFAVVKLFVEVTAPVETRRVGAAGAKCPIPGLALVVRAAELVLMEPATLLARVEPVDPVLAVDVVESVPPAAPTLEPLVLTWPVALTFELVVVLLDDVE